MSALHQSNELVFQISPNPHKKHKISEDLILGPQYASLDVTVFDTIIKKGNNRRRKLIAAAGSENSCGLNSNTSNNNNNKKKKKMMMKHRDVERLRRQEMANLYASLRSLLPLELIKGKRSISDHVIEAVNYIKLLQNKIKKLGGERDELKKYLSNSTTCSEHGSGSSSSTSPPASRLTVQPFSSGVEIIIISSSSSFRERSFPFSRVLDVLLQEGLSMVDCVSTTVNDKLLHKIHSDQVKNLETINLPSLEKKLTEAISSYNRIE